MFVQIISGTVKDEALMRRQDERWRRELKPSVKGFLGSTGGVTPDGRTIAIIRFESREAAMSNSDSDEQNAWWNETAKAFDGEPTFIDTEDVLTPLGGGSEDAGFVQVIQGRAKDPQAMRDRLPEMEQQLRKERPDILGMLVAWHGDGKDFTQAVYFRSEQEARAKEQEMQSSELRQEYEDMFEGPPTFWDLPHPEFD